MIALDDRMFVKDIVLEEVVDERTLWYHIYKQMSVYWTFSRWYDDHCLYGWDVAYNKFRRCASANTKRLHYIDNGLVISEAGQNGAAQVLCQPHKWLAHLENKHFICSSWKWYIKVMKRRAWRGGRYMGGLRGGFSRSPQHKLTVTKCRCFWLLYFCDSSNNITIIICLNTPEVENHDSSSPLPSSSEVLQEILCVRF